LNYNFGRITIKQSWFKNEFELYAILFWRWFMEKKLEFGEVLKEGFSLGLKNAGSIIVNVLLWILTIWIPYLNIGTTIGLLLGVIAKASKNESIAMTEIFNPEYRKYMGDFFLTAGLMSIGVSIGTALFVAPGIVLAIAWSQSLLLAVDKGKSPTEALNLSNKVTYGNKGTMFLVNLVVAIAFAILSVIFMQIPYLDFILIFVAGLLLLFVNIGIQAHIYQKLCSDI